MPDLIPVHQAARMLGFTTAHAFVEFCEREKDKGAPKIVKFSARKRFVDREKFDRWLREKLGAAA